MTAITPEKQFLLGLQAILRASDIHTQLIDILQGNASSLKIQEGAVKKSIFLSKGLIDALKPLDHKELKFIVAGLVEGIRKQQVIYKQKMEGGDTQYYASHEMREKIKAGEEFPLKNKTIVIAGEKAREVKGPTKEINFTTVDAEVFEEAAAKTEEAFKGFLEQDVGTLTKEKPKEEKAPPLAKQAPAKQATATATKEEPRPTERMAEDAQEKGQKQALTALQEEEAIRKEEEKKKLEKEKDEKEIRIEKEELKKEAIKETVAEKEESRVIAAQEENVSEAIEAEHRGEDPPQPTKSTSAGAP